MIELGLRVHINFFIEQKRMGSKMEKMEFVNWMRTRPIDRHLAKTMTEVEIQTLKDKVRLK